MNMLTFIILSVIFVGSVGCLMHFLYKMCHQAKIVAVVAAVNESVWEHVKIGLTGFFLWTIVEVGMYGGERNYWIAKAAQLLSFVVGVPLFYFLILKVTKKHVVWVSVFEFFFCIFLSELAFFGVLNAPFDAPYWLYFPAFLIIFYIVCDYLVYTWVTPKNKLFRDPRNGKYGCDAYMDKHKHGAERKKKEVKEAPTKLAKNDDVSEVKEAPTNLAKKPLSKSEKSMDFLAPSKKSVSVKSRAKTPVVTKKK